MASTDVTRAVNPLRNDIANNGAFYANGRYTGIFRDSKGNPQLRAVVAARGGTFLATSASARPDAIPGIFEDFKRMLLFNGSAGGTYDWDDWGLPWLNDCGIFPDAIVKNVYIYDSAGDMFVSILFSVSPEQPYTPFPPLPAMP